MPAELPLLGLQAFGQPGAGGGLGVGHLGKPAGEPRLGGDQRHRDQENGGNSDQNDNGRVHGHS